MNEVIRNNILQGSTLVNNLLPWQKEIVNKAKLNIELSSDENKQLLSWWLIHRQDADEAERLLCGGEELWNRINKRLDHKQILLTSITPEVLGAKFIDGITPGTFIDMFGREVTIEEDEIDAYYTNTLEALEHTRTEKGDLAGLPIDGNAHDKGDAVGWIVGLKKAVGLVGQPIIQFAVQWNEAGLEKIRKKLKKGFSPTLNLQDKIALGGSLTNWPASVTQEGKLLLRPLELSNNVYQFIHNDKENNVMAEMHDFDKDAFKAELITDMKGMFTEMLSTLQPQGQVAKPNGDGDDDLVDITDLSLISGEHAEQITEAIDAQLNSVISGIDSQVDQRVAHRINLIRRNQREIELVASVDNPESRYSLSTDKEQLKTFLSSLSSIQFDFFVDLMEGITEGTSIVDLGERGSSQANEEGVEKLALPDYYAEALREGKITIAQLSTPQGLGANIKDYDLSEFENKD